MSLALLRLSPMSSLTTLSALVHNTEKTVIWSPYDGSGLVVEHLGFVIVAGLGNIAGLGQ